ncbi:FACT complex subunit SSRP1 [Populus alba x Populus x berolinensis]|uniref:FACT complex subunit SSRP1 n=1 Tax=Populus alba x Populus x berolinensis TaxID=444605 RepID=A0AAD6R1Z4_9ROSI|nr:FACT complex subunit SSRP1 [Populus alba x Populus x berolinensis]
MTDGHLFNNIFLGGRGGTNPGHLKISPGGILWKKQGGGKAVEVDRADILGVTWMKVPRTNQLSVLIKGGPWYKFTGFRDQDLSTLTNFFQSHGITPEEKQLSVSGRNWGEVDLNGNMLTFLVGSKQAFEVSLADVSQTQMQGKNDVILEFHVDDTTGANEKDSLMELSFHIPNNNTQYIGDENHPPAQVFRDLIVQKADVGAGGEEAVVTFEGIAILTPRGRYSVELHLSFLRLQGQANDFKIQYSSVVRLFLLPKFDTDFVVQSNLSMSEDLLYTKYKDKLEPSYKGLIHEVFTTILRGLSSAKVTRPGKFRSCQDGYAVKSSLKAEDGVLYPLEKSFFFLPKPPTLILHEEIDYVEFERHAAGGSNMHYFDLLIRLKTEQEHLFRNIQRNEYHNLFDFIRMKISSSGRMMEVLLLMILERKNLMPVKNPGKKDFKREVSSSKAVTKRKSRDGEESQKKRKPKKKKDPNAPKRSKSAYVIFSQMERENVKKSNPGIVFGEITKALADKWNAMSAEEKEPYEEMARDDKQRYKSQVQLII